MGRLIISLLLPAAFASAMLLGPPTAHAGANQIPGCGGDGQRACCAGTFEVLLGDACDSGNTEVPGCSGECLCGGVNPFSINASGTCKARETCGGENERACCDGLLEGRACEAGLIKIEGCAGNCLCGGIGTGQVSVHTCVKPTPCGGEGQRACCALPSEPRRLAIGGPCEGDLVEIPGCAGDCACGDEIASAGTSSGTCVADDWASTDIAEPETQWTESAQARTCALQGYADMHIHLNAHLAHGGQVFAGMPAPVDETGSFTLVSDLSINTALSAADDELLHAQHGIFGDTVGDGTKDGSAGNTGAPAFNNWPTWTTTTHQQMYYPWLERAYRGGLRLAVMFAVTNEALCKSSDGSDCTNSMGPIDAQLDAAYDFQRFIDELSGGPGEGWFRIVTEPSQARQVIADGKLAVVLGIEVDNLFNCKEQNASRPDAQCPNMVGADGDLIRNAAGEPVDTIEKAVALYYEKGVRHIFPIHNFDNAYGAAATWQDVIGIGNAYSEQRWWEVEDCGTGNGDYGFWIDNALSTLIALIGFEGQVPPVPVYKSGLFFPDFASCNKYGLNLNETSAGPDKRGHGGALIKALMAKGMLIDIDHMSTRSLDETLELTRTTTPQYPLVASHVQFFDLHEMEFGDNAGRHERMRTAAQLAAIKESGGLVAAMTKDDVQDTGKKGAKFTLPYQPLLGASITDDCRHSSSSFAQAYQYAVDVMGAPVALGSDFNGVAGHVGPRFGSDACGGDLPFSTEASSTIERSAQIRDDRRLEYPFTLKGFGEFDRQVSGLKSFDFNVDGLAHAGLLPDLIKDMETIGLSDIYLEALFNSAEEYIRVWERAKAISEGTSVPSPSQDLSCPPVALCVGADQTPPDVSCPEDRVTECTGILTDVIFDPATASADGCGAAIFQGCNPASGTAFELGQTPVICTAIDNSRNVGSCQFEVKVQDTVAPDITAPDDRLQECSSPEGTPVTLGAPTTSDRCDAGPTVIHDAPAVFSLGSTQVTWTSTDDYNNVGMSTQKVTVLDRTPPDLTVLLTPSVLWPPNHKLVTVRADIQGVDLCDAAPDITLVSIASNESDDGQGDGNTLNDIHGAVFGTDDREFQIRAERSGNGNGRVYTITYQATDASGNTTLKQANVTVPITRK